MYCGSIKEIDINVTSRLEKIQISNITKGNDSYTKQKHGIFKYLKKG
jgi:hypothetical protein